MKTCTKRLLGRLISIERGKLTKRMQLIRQRHSTKMDENIYSIIQLDENKYVITKIVGKSEIQSYDVHLDDINCQCEIECIDCNICIHTLTCTCIDYNIRFVLCKHIHYA